METHEHVHRQTCTKSGAAFENIDPHYSTAKERSGWLLVLFGVLALIGGLAGLQSLERAHEEAVAIAPR